MAEEGDQQERTGEDTSLGRLLALSDGVFAIAMTLLALDLRVPDLVANATDADLRRALADEVPRFLAYLLSFYVVAGYWARHRRLLRSAVAVAPPLLRLNLVLLLIVGSLPFLAALLGEHGDLGTAVALYGAVNVVGMGVQLRMARVVDERHLAATPTDHSDAVGLRGDLVVFALSVPLGYLLAPYGALVLVLLVISGRLERLARRREPAEAG